MQNPLIPKHRLSGICYLIEDTIYMKRILPSLLLILTASFNIQSVYAQESNEPELQNLPQEDRETAREARREQIQNMTEEERAAAREQVKARRESMPHPQDINFIITDKVADSVVINQQITNTLW